MMKPLVLLIAVFCCTTLTAQNVGIGTAAPLAPLHIKATAGEGLRLQSGDPFISFYDNSNSYGAYIWLNKLFGNNFQLGTPPGSGIPISIAPNDQLALYAVPGGKVGVATTTPATRLDIAGSNAWDLVNGEGDVRIGNSSYRIKMGVALGGGGVGAAGIMQAGGIGSLSLGANSKYLLQLNGIQSFVDFQNNTGGIRINGNPGSTLQVLSSNGASGSAQWRGMYELLGRNIMQPYYESGSLFLLNDESVQNSVPFAFNLATPSSVVVYGPIRLRKTCAIYPCFSSVRVKVFVDAVERADWTYTGVSMLFNGSPTDDHKTAGPVVFDLAAGAHSLSFTVQSQQGAASCNVKPQVFIVSK